MEKTIKEMSIEIAKSFHEKYETLAPQYGYETRKDTRVFDENSPNGQLMCHVVREVLGEIFVTINKLEAKVAEGEKAKEIINQIITYFTPYLVVMKNKYPEFINMLQDYQKDK